MPTPSAYTYQRYLAAKMPIDDRSLNQNVWNDFKSRIHSLNRPVRLLEIGSGIGTMFERAYDWGLFQDEVEYTAVEHTQNSVDTARKRLIIWGEENGFNITKRDDCICFRKDGLTLYLHLICADLLEWVPTQSESTWDGIIGQAVLDLFDVPAVLPGFINLLKPDGAWYFSINFDGATLFEPALDKQLDDQYEALYHQTMDDRESGGDSRSGRHLFSQIKTAGGITSTAGSSDWVVFSHENNQYQHDEAYFLHHILYFFESVLGKHPAVDQAQLNDWIVRRRKQIESGELIYIAHQLDLTGYRKS